MHRIDGPGAAPGGHFTEGDPAIGTIATWVTGTWAEALQEEVCGVVEGAGIALAKPDNGQLLAAIQKLIKRATPVGQVIQGYFPAAPAGFLLCNGTLVLRSAYPDLWAWVNSNGLTVADASWSTNWTLFGTGDGSTTFRLPDLRAEFVRGADFGRGVDSGRAVGSWQQMELQAHSHGGVPLATGDTDRGGLASSFSLDDVGATASAGGLETRPRNVALAFCVRY